MKEAFEEDLLDFGDSEQSEEITKKDDEVKINVKPQSKQSEKSIKSEENLNKKPSAVSNLPKAVNESIDNSTGEKFVLYVVSDRSNDGILTYFREHGVFISNMFSSIEDARNAMLMQINKYKLIILDTGLGKFIGVGARKLLVDLIGVCDDNVQIDIFYVDNLVKKAVESKAELDNKNIKWHTYRGTADVLANVLTDKKAQNIQYIKDVDSTVVKPINIEKWKKTKGYAFDYKVVGDAGVPSITHEQFFKHQADESNIILEVYEPKI